MWFLLTSVFSRQGMMKAAVLPGGGTEGGKEGGAEEGRRKK